MLVDLFTYDAELELIILESFPDKISPEQHQVDESEPGIKVFCFYDLNNDNVTEFFGQYKSKHEYELRSKKGEFIEVNSINKLEADLINYN
jgi:hypothetical protein